MPQAHLISRAANWFKIGSTRSTDLEPLTETQPFLIEIQAAQDRSETETSAKPAPQSAISYRVTLKGK